MERALELARLGGGWTHPNPRVGAVLVRDGVIVGEGYHARVGGPHAEVVALAAAGEAARAPPYVTASPANTTAAPSAPPR
jgi:diaminohydroxyphosphoribosylaminopyrimidine deaminase/5-amino-6-(5-phosphoribosylamino)uracil reductase